MVFLLKYYFSFSPEDCSNTNFYLFLRKNKLFKKLTRVFLKITIFKKTCIGSFCHLRVSEVIQVWHTLTPKNYMRFWMSVFWCFILGPSGGFLNYFFEWDVTPDGYPLSTGKKTRGHVPPPPRKKTLAKQQPRIVYTVLKKNRDGFFFQRFTLGKPKTFSRTTRQMVFFAEILLFFLFERS